MSTTKGGGVVRFVMKNTIRREGWDDLVCQQCFVWKKRVAAEASSHKSQGL